MFLTVSLAEYRGSAQQSYAAWSERDLLDAARGGDRSAAEELVERTYGMIYAALFRLCGGDADRASDLTQESYQKAWEALAGFEGRAKFSTWLYRIAYTTFLNSLRRPQRVVPLEERVAEVLADESPAADDVLARTEESETVSRAVLDLPDDMRFTVTAHFWGGLAVKEIARMEKVTTVAIRKRLHKAFALLGTALASEGR